MVRFETAATVAALLLVAGCGSPATAPSPDTETARPSAPASAGPSAADEPQVTELLSGLTTPWGLVTLRDGRLLISERDTRRIVVVQDGQAAPLRTIDDASPAGEGGLLGLAVTADEQTVFAYFTAAEDNRIVSMSWDGTTLGEPRPILTGIPKGGRHNGGRMVLGPDGDLYVGTGETGDTDHAQDKTSLGGKILRITTEGKPAPGNPFSNEVYSYGHRNVEGLAFDAQGRLWASEFGEQTWDELNLITKGGNYGWPEVEGSGQVAGMINPKVVWSTSEASPSGLAFWRGSLWMAALRGARLWQIPVDGESTGTPVAHFTQRYGRIRSVTVSADGNALLVTNSNTDGRGDPAADDDRLLELTG